MSEERLQEIKDSVEFQKEILIAHNMETLCVDEEQELIEEIERLHSIIKEVREYIKFELEEVLKVNRYDLHYHTIDGLHIKRILEILDKGE